MIEAFFYEVGLRWRAWRRAHRDRLSVHHFHRFLRSLR